MEYPNAKKKKGITSGPNPFPTLKRKGAENLDMEGFPDMLKVLQKGLDAGCGFIISRTRDGGALSLTVLDGDTRHRSYPASGEELQDVLDGLVEYFTLP